MGCGKKDKDTLGKHSCICEVVRAIKDIQDNVMEEDCECPKNCFLEPLGALDSPKSRKKPANTRVFVLKTADGSPFHAFFRSRDCNCVSIFFRVEEVFDNCCATLRVLRPTKRGDGSRDTLDLTKNCCIDLDRVCNLDYDGFLTTNDCITVDLSCFCAIQCITDTFIEDICD